MKWLLVAAVLPAALISCSRQEARFTVEEVNFPSTQNSAVPYLFSDPSGRVHLTWIERIDTVNYLKLAHWQNEAWSDPVTITSGTDWFVNWADYPMAVSDGGEKYLAHILKKSGEGTFAYDVAMTHTDDGISWSKPIILHDDGKQAEHGFVYFVPYGDHVVVSWLDGRNTASEESVNHDDHGHHGAMSLRAAVLKYDGTKLNEWELDERVCDCCQTTAAITANGPVVIYRDRSGEEVRDISIVRLVDNRWTAPQTIYPDNWTINGCPVNGPRCEAVGNTLAIAWFTMADDQAEVKVIFSDDGGATFGKPTRVDEGNPIGRVDLVLLDEQRALVSWMEGAEIKMIEVTKDGQKLNRVTVATSSEARSSGFPQLTKTQQGVMAAWTDVESETIKVLKITR